MTNITDIREMKARITVFGVGGAGGNAVNNMIASGLEGVDFIVANTDAQALTMSRAAAVIQMGAQVTKGLGAGSHPEVGRASAEESIEVIRDHLAGTNMVFVTAGMGGGTGTGAAPVIARAARELGILTIGVVTKPFHFEGHRRMRFAEAGIADLLTEVDTLLIIPNQNLFRVANEKTTFTDAFALADQVLYSGVACISDLIVKEGLINLDFADVLSIMREKGRAMMGRAEASGEGRVLAAAVAAMSNPLIEDPSIKRASGLIISITGGKDMSLYEVDEAVTRIREQADPDANIIVGASFDDTMEGSVRVAVVATGIDNVDAARAAQMGETLTALAGRLNDDAFRASEPGVNELADDRFGYAPQAAQRTHQAAQRAPLPQVASPPLRPRSHEAAHAAEMARAREMARAHDMARPVETARAVQGRSVRPIADNTRHATPQGLEAYRPRANMRSAAHVPSATEDDILETPAFLRRPAG